MSGNLHALRNLLLFDKTGLTGTLKLETDLDSIGISAHMEKGPRYPPLMAQYAHCRCSAKRMDELVRIA